MTRNPDIDICNGLLRWELSAVETYVRAVNLFPHASVRPILEEILADHRKCATGLRDHVRQMGGSAADAPAAWEGFLASVEGSARLFGPRSALVALLQGEEAGRSAYDTALAERRLSPQSQKFVRSFAMPRLQLHITTLRGITRKSPTAEEDPQLNVTNAEGAEN